MIKLTDQQKYNRLVGFLVGENLWSEIWEGEKAIEIPEVIISNRPENSQFDVKR